MSSTSGSAEPEIIGVARAKAEYIKAEMMAEFKRLDAGETQLTPAVVKIFERKWEKELNELDERVFAASLSPDSQPHISPLREDEKARQRAQREARMEKFKRGEKPD